MANATSPTLHDRNVSGRHDHDSRNCTPQSSPHSESSNTRSLFDTTDELSHSAGPLSPACPSIVSFSSTASLFNLSSPLPSAPFLPRPPSLKKPTYNNITPPASHAQQLNSLVCLLVKPVKRKVLVSKVRVLMEQARQRYASKRKRELRDRMQFEQEVANAQHAAAVAAATAAPQHTSLPFSSHHDEDESASETGRLQDLFTERSERFQQSQPTSSFDLSGLPLLPVPSLLSSSIQQSCPPDPLSLSAMASLARDSSSDSRPSPSMLRSLDRLTAAARSTSAPAAHAVFLPSRPNSGSNSPIREEGGARRLSVSNHHHRQHHHIHQHEQESRGSSPFSAASTASPSTSVDSPEDSAPSSSRSSSAASSNDSPNAGDAEAPRHSRTQSLSSALWPQHVNSMPASPPTSLSQLRVLVAEDTVTNQKIIARMLQRLGVAQVDIVNDGRECLQAVMGHSSADQQNDRSQAPPHCILMDLLMPVMDGWQATERLRAAGYDMPIVALSASAMKSDRVRCDEVGCSAFLSKPTKLDTLRETLERLVLAQR